MIETYSMECYSLKNNSLPPACAGWGSECTGFINALFLRSLCAVPPALPFLPAPFWIVLADPPFPFQFSLLLALTWNFGDERKEIIFLLVKAIFSGHSCLDPLEIKQEEIEVMGKSSSWPKKNPMRI